jgi:hypothetical protein
LTEDAPERRVKVINVGFAVLLNEGEYLVIDLDFMHRHLTRLSLLTDTLSTHAPNASPSTQKTISAGRCGGAKFAEPP